MSNDQAIEQKIQTKGLTAARITPADIEANIISEHYFTAWDGSTASGDGMRSIWHDDKDAHRNQGNPCAPDDQAGIQRLPRLAATG